MVRDPEALMAVRHRQEEQFRHDLFQRLAVKLRGVEDPLAGPPG